MEKKEGRKEVRQYAKANAKRTLKVVEQGVEFVEERHRALRKQLRRGA
jgi:hypothetical protein